MKKTFPGTAPLTAASAGTNYVRNVLRQKSFVNSIFPKFVKLKPRSAHQLMRDALRIEKLLNTPNLLETVKKIELNTHSTGTAFILCPYCNTNVRFEGGSFNFTREQLPDAPASMVGNGATVQLCYCCEAHSSLFINGSNDVLTSFTPTLNWMMPLPNDFLDYE